MLSQESLLPPEATSGVAFFLLLLSWAPQRGVAGLSSAHWVLSGAILRASSRLPPQGETSQCALCSAALPAWPSLQVQRDRLSPGSLRLLRGLEPALGEH